MKNSYLQLPVKFMGWVMASYLSMLSATSTYVEPYVTMHCTNLEKIPRSHLPIKTCVSILTEESYDIRYRGLLDIISWSGKDYGSTCTRVFSLIIIIAHLDTKLIISVISWVVIISMFKEGEKMIHTEKNDIYVNFYEYHYVNESATSLWILMSVCVWLVGWLVCWSVCWSFILKAGHFHAPHDP